MKNFLKYSVLLGRQPELVQGAGGNTSVKFGNTLVVKASGYFLKDVAKSKGYVTCNILPIKKYLFALKKYNSNLELPFNTLVESYLNIKKSFGKPSIETGLHAVIQSKYVFHTHSALANVLNFANGGKSIIRSLFPNALVIPYKNPGLELAFVLLAELKKHKVLSPVIFLQNHGLITHSNNAAEAYELTINAQNKIIAYLKKQKAYKPFVVSKSSANLKKHMFPDSVVYSQINFKKLPAEKKQVYYEICSLINFTQNTIKLLKKQPVFLPQSRVKFLTNMEQEKHRIKMLHSYK